MKKTSLKTDHWYKFKEQSGEVHIGQFLGRCEGFECCVCGKGENAYCFNIWYCKEDYETWGYGKEHMPEILEDLGTSEEVIVDR